MDFERGNIIAPLLIQSNSVFPNQQNLRLFAFQRQFTPLCVSDDNLATRWSIGSSSSFFRCNHLSIFELVPCVQSFHDAEAAADPTNLGWDSQGGLRVVTLLLVRWWVLKSNCRYDEIMQSTIVIIMTLFLKRLLYILGIITQSWNWENG